MGEHSNRNHENDRLKGKNGFCYRRKDIISESGETYKRLAIQTHFVERGESYIELVERYVLPVSQPGDILSISEKVITMCQNNIVEKKDVPLGFWAKTLSRFASSNHHGVAMDQPYKLQLAINLCGLPRILLAAFCSAVTKPFGIRGVFYRVAGHGVAGIDGFYPGSAFDLYHDIALLNPVEPCKVCNEIQKNCGVDCMIVDANDLNVELLGKSDTLKQVPNRELSSMIRDNPAGQSDELTPFILIRKKTDDMVDFQDAG
jgi:F420-0:gamma-glutamyl ligase-like protein